MADINGDNMDDYIYSFDNIGFNDDANLYDGIHVYLATGGGKFQPKPVITTFANFGSGTSNTESTFLTCGLVSHPEQCDNQIDDDLNGLTDCADPACSAHPICQIDTDKDKVIDKLDHCPKTPLGGIVNTQGCPFPTDVSTVKTASTTNIKKGIPFSYTITVTNNGPAETHNVLATDTIDPRLTINSVTVSNSGKLTRNGQAIEAVWPIVPSGAIRTITVTVQQ